MSFILDALKKSENDRQRQSGPALFEVRVPPPRAKFPLLAVAIVSLLVVNVGVVAWLMLRKPAEAAVPPAQAAATAPPSAQPAPNAQPVSPPLQGAAPQAAPGSVQSPPANMPPPQYGAAATNAGTSAPNGNPAPLAANGYSPAAANNGYPPAGAGAFGRTPSQEPVLSDAAQQPPRALNPDDYEPAREASPPGNLAGRVTRSTESGLPTYEEAATHATIPPLHMDLHSYAPDPSKRFVLINMRRLYEGQSLPEGPKVESITNDAAIMSFQGTRFVLDKE
jgi:general secretion pathway protein B